MGERGCEGDAAEGDGMVLWFAAVFLQAFFLNRLMYGADAERVSL